MNTSIAASVPAASAAADTSVSPAERRRDQPPAWADTVPECRRSEAFAEDLGEDLSDTPPRADATPGTAVLPLLSMALAVTLGWLGR
ncbi:MAG: hypothetical protein H7Z19_17655 [Chitinophagaceae bacterium]|nr:hypothetical protein [Rubrivivax sp.]